MENANVHVIPYSETYYSVRENYLPTADKLWFRWDGIVDPVGIENCQVKRLLLLEEFSKQVL